MVKAHENGTTYPGDKQIHRREFVMSVRVGLKEDEREPIVKELTDKYKDKDALNLEAANIAATYRGRIKKLKEEMDELVLKLDQGIPEDTEVEEIKDFKKKTVTTVRRDTRAVVMKREMIESDYQLDLGGAPDPEEEGNDGQGAAGEEAN